MSSLSVLPFVLLALSAVHAAPASEGAVCSDGTAVTNAVCCDFIPVGRSPHITNVVTDHITDHILSLLKHLLRLFLKTSVVKLVGLNNTCDQQDAD